MCVLRRLGVIGYGFGYVVWGNMVVFGVGGGVARVWCWLVGRLSVKAGAC